MKKLIMFVFLNLFIFPASATFIDKTKEQVIQDVKTYAETLDGNDIPYVKEILSKATFVPENEWEKTCRNSTCYSLKIYENLVFKIYVEWGTHKVTDIQLLYPKDGALDSDVIAMKKLMGYVANYEFHTNKKLKRQFLKFMNTPYNSEGFGNLAIINNYRFSQYEYNKEMYSFSISDGL